MQVVSYDPQRRSLKVRLDDKSILVDGLGDDVVFRKQARGRPEEMALWLNRTQAEVLAKMVDYSLRKLRITDASRQALEEVLPEIQQLVQGHEGPPASQPPESPPEDAPPAEPA